jgi:hypothetical protein
MKKLILSGLAVALALAATGTTLPAQTKATVTNVATIPHEAVPNFFKNPPGIYTGENMGISTNSKGNIYIYHRANETRLFEYSPQGRSFARSAAASTATRSRTRCASTPRTTSGRSMKAPT